MSDPSSSVRPPSAVCERPLPDGRMRAQTTLDFAIGIGVFLVVVVFVLAFAPGMLDPFTGGAGEKRVASNRVADTLSQGMLGDPVDPYVLDVGCTVAFFDPVNNDGSTTNDAWEGGCRYERTNDLNARVGAAGRPAGTGFDLRVRILGEDADGDGSLDVLCWDAATTAVVPESHADCDTGDVVLEVGSTSPTKTGTVVVARRGVYLPQDEGTDATLVVEVW